MNDDRADIVWYVWRNYRYLMTEEEKDEFYRLAQAEPQPSEMQPFFERVVDRILRDHPKWVVLKRCPKCNHLLASRWARMCLRCDWSEF